MGKKRLASPFLEKLFDAHRNNVRRQCLVALLSRHACLGGGEASHGPNGDEARDEFGVTKREVQGNSPAEGIANHRDRLRERGSEKVSRIGQVGPNGSVVSVTGQVDGDDVTRRCQELSKVVRRRSGLGETMQEQNRRARSRMMQVEE